MNAIPKQRILVLHGYVKQADARRFVGVCLTLNLVVEAPSLDDAKAKLDALIVAYLADAIEQDEFNAFVPRRAPFGRYLEYGWLRIENGLHALRTPFYVFTETRLVPQHA